MVPKLTGNLGASFCREEAATQPPEWPCYRGLRFTDHQRSPRCVRSSVETSGELPTPQKNIFLKTVTQFCFLIKKPVVSGSWSLLVDLPRLWYHGVNWATCTSEKRLLLVVKWSPSLLEVACGDVATFSPSPFGRAKKELFRLKHHGSPVWETLVEKEEHLYTHNITAHFTLHCRHYITAVVVL